MKYFTKEELEDITKELIDNPARETLNKLNEKYNGNIDNVVVASEIPVAYNQDFEVASIVEPQQNETSNEVQKDLGPTITPIDLSMPAVNETEVNLIPNENISNVEVPKLDNNEEKGNINASSLGIPSFELPKLDAPIVDFQNNEHLNFTGNLFETPQSTPNLMQTTDSFNTVQKIMPTTEVSVAGTPFFGQIMSGESNPIPVGGPINNMPVNESSMFGQFEQNNM